MILELAFCMALLEEEYAILLLKMMRNDIILGTTTFMTSIIPVICIEFDNIHRYRNIRI